MRKIISGGCDTLHNPQRHSGLVEGGPDKVSGAGTHPACCWSFCSRPGFTSLIFTTYQADDLRQVTFRLFEPQVSHLNNGNETWPHINNV